MTQKKFIVLTHGGAGSRDDYDGGTRWAAEVCLESLRSGNTVIDSVCAGIAALEDDPRFNAGLSSHKRADGSMQMDAAVMTGAGRFGAVTALEGFKNPIHVARAVSETSNILLAGRGANEFAQNGGFEILAPEAVSGGAEDFSSVKDTVGCVAGDGEQFAVGLSTGGTSKSHPGRVGDVPLIGCGLYAGPKGAVAATGDGETIALKLTAYRAYELIEKGEKADSVLEAALGWFRPDEAFGIILVTQDGYAGGCNRSMAWSAREESPGGLNNG